MVCGTRRGVLLHFLELRCVTMGMGKRRGLLPLWEGFLRAASLNGSRTGVPVGLDGLPLCQTLAQEKAVDCCRAGLGFSEG